MKKMICKLSFIWNLAIRKISKCKTVNCETEEYTPSVSVYSLTSIIHLHTHTLTNSQSYPDYVIALTSLYFLQPYCNLNL